MSLKKIKQQNTPYNLSVLDLLRILDPSKTGKFMTLLLNELKSIPPNELEDEPYQNIGIPLENLVPLNRVLLIYLVELVGGLETIKSLSKFLELSEKKLIKKNDIQKYNNLLELTDEIYRVELELNNKSVLPHSTIIVDTKDYLILKPLNIISSRKYGASTKWCTSSINDETFYSYSSKGILLYIMSRQNNTKWAVYYELDKKELSWWNSKDERIDGLMVNLPKNIKNEILEHILNEKHPNSHYFNKETKELSNKPTNEMSIIPNGEVVNTPEPFTGVWRNPQNSPTWTSTTTDERIDELVNKTLEYHYTIGALRKGGEEIN